MPGWHERSKAIAARGELKVAGIVQEQHGDRAALFMQWKQMSWPVMVDSLNLLGVRGVPTTLLVDESGIIRSVNPKPADLEIFLATDFQPAKIEAPQFEPDDEATSLAVATLSGAPLEPAIAALRAQTKANPKEAAAHFQLGVLLRGRHDSDLRHATDFAAAVAAWRTALELVPSQYIWRRRIQQYGPRLDKPYPFYDWVPTARTEISARGESPMPLVAEPSGAEIAKPERGVVDGEPFWFEHADPEGRLPQDTKPLIELRAVAVPSTDRKSRAYRVHLEFEPAAARGAHWNNESGQSRVWVEQPEGWRCDATTALLADPDRGAKAVNVGTRRAEIELHPRSADAPAPRTLKGSALYFVCEGADGTCQYLRTDFEIDLPR